MDEGPFRVSRPAENRRGVNRPEPQRQQAEAQQLRQEPSAEQSAHRAPSQKKAAKRKKLPIILAILIVAVLVVAGLLWFGSRSTGTGIDTTKYQAVFFTNGQVYFGKLEALNDDYMKLTNIYYLQTQSEEATDSENPQETSTGQSNVQLIKLGDEIHGPEDEMILSKDQILFYENLKSDGKVAQSIDQFKKSN